MSDRFEELIRTSTPEMPESSEYRRLNRVPLREPFHLHERRKRRHSFVTVVACLALMFLASGQLNPLGSDDLELEVLTGTNWNGQEQTLYRDTFTGMVFNSDGSPERVQDLQHAFLAQDGDPVMVTCLAYGGVSSWVVYQLSLIEGQYKKISMDNPPELPRDDPPEMIKFYKTYFRDLRMRADHLPPDGVMKMTIHEVEFLVKSWKKTYPGFGEVTYSVGLPVGE